MLAASSVHQFFVLVPHAYGSSGSDGPQLRSESPVSLIKMFSSLYRLILTTHPALEWPPLPFSPASLEEV